MVHDRGSTPARVRVIDRSSPVPYYHQLKEIVREQILAGDLQPGDQLDGEHVLCDTFGVSRPVVRQALSELQREGILDRVKGRGTFVAQPRTSQGLVQSLHGLYDDVLALGRELRSRVVSQIVEPAGPEIAEALHIPKGTAVVQVKRIRHVDGEPWVSTVSRVPLHLAPDLVDQDLSSQSLYHLLEDRYGLSISSSLRTVEANKADATLARELGIAKNDPVLKLTSVSYDEAGSPIETFVAYHRADRSRFEVRLTRVDDTHRTVAPED